MSGHNDEFEVVKKAHPDSGKPGIQDDDDVTATKERLRQEWLSDHPDKTAEDFDATAWPELREKLLDNDL